MDEAINGGRWLKNESAMCCGSWMLCCARVSQRRSSMARRQTMQERAELVKGR